MNRYALFLRAALAALSLATLATPALRAQNGTGAPTTVAPDGRDEMKLQTIRTVAVKEMGKTIYHQEEFDLSGLPTYAPREQVSGKLRVWGLNYMGDCGLSTAWADGFRKYQPGLKIEYNLPTALIGVPGLVCGRADLVASRPISRDELMLFERILNNRPTGIKLATGSYDVPGYATTLAIINQKANPISKLTLKELDGIFGAQRTGGYDGLTWHPEVARGPEGNIRKWGQLGATGEWAAKTINIYMFSFQYHFIPIFQTIVFHGGEKWNENVSEFQNYVGADGKTVIQDAQVIAALEKDRYGIALTMVRSMTPKTKVIAIARDEGGPYVDLTLKNVQNLSYPLAYQEYWYFNHEAGKPIDPRIREYLRYVLSREGQQAVNRTGKFNPLPAQTVREELAKLE